MPESDLKVETQLNVAKSPAEAYEAIVSPQHMAGYFISAGTGRLDAGQPVTWSWSDVGAELTVTPQEVEADSKISFLWSASGVETKVVIQLERNEAGETDVKVCESGWPRDDQGTARCLQQMQGWMHMLCCLKAYLEFGINLRTGTGPQ